MTYKVGLRPFWKIESFSNIACCTRCVFQLRELIFHRESRLKIMTSCLRSKSQYSLNFFFQRFKYPFSCIHLCRPISRLPCTSRINQCPFAWVLPGIVIFFFQQFLAFCFCTCQLVTYPLRLLSSCAFVWPRLEFPLRKPSFHPKIALLLIMLFLC